MSRTSAVLVLALGLTVACGRSSEAPAVLPEPVVTVSAATLRAGQPVPAPRDAPVLELTGKVSAANVGRVVRLDLATLRRMGVVQVRVFEPWVKEDLTFHGVWLTDLLAVAGAPAGASVRITALDDYVVDLTAADLAAGGILLGISDGTGKDLPIESGGPTRIIFAGGAAAGANPDRWIWSLRSIDVR